MTEERIGQSLEVELIRGEEVRTLVVVPAELSG
jgi:hypothetical protein